MADQQNRLELRIRGYTPDDVPMAKLAEYIAAFAALLGHAENVRFDGVVKGSLVVRARYAPDAGHSVMVRLANVDDPASSDEVRSAYRRLDSLLRRDKADGVVRRPRGATIVYLPGARTQTPKPVEVEQVGTLDGRIIRMGGLDSTIPVHVLDDQDKEVKCDAPLEVARSLKLHLLEPTQLRFFGPARYFRDASGNWTLSSLRIQSFEVLDDLTPTQWVERLRSLNTGWSAEENPLRAHEVLRG